ncbi:MAG: hypothetical protein RSB32_08035 [Mucinivorans sp.]
MANELNTIVESSLGGLAAGRTIATVRVVDDTGGSANASPTQIREMTGIDHSILTEQIVPGEYFPYKDGTKRQVFCRTFVGTTPVEDNLYGIILNTGINAIPVSAIGNIDGMSIYSTSYHPSNPANASSSINVARSDGYDRGDIIITSTRRGSSPYPKGIPYTITIKYIKP